MTNEDDDTFLARWARRKEAVRQGRDAPETKEPAPSPAAEPDSSALADETADTELLESLPDIDSLTLESDFTLFLRRGVPEALRRKALRKLWRLDPVFANLDGLNNYDEDYTKLGKVVLPELRSLYRVGRGMSLGEAPASEAPVGKAAESKKLATDTANDGPRRAESPQDPTVDPKTPAATPPAPEGTARTDGAVQPDELAETTPLSGHEDESVPGGGTPDAASRRSAAARRWGKSSG